MPGRVFPAYPPLRRGVTASAAEQARYERGLAVLNAVLTAKRVFAERGLLPVAPPAAD